MKHYKSFLLITALFFGLIVQSCENADNDHERDQMDNRFDAAESNNDYNNDLAQYKKETETRIQENNRKIRSLKNGNSANESEMSEERKQQLQKLENQNRTLQDELNEFEANSKEAWQEFKSDFNRQMAKIERELKELTDGDGEA